MPRKLFKKWLPHSDRLRELRILRPFGARLHHPNLWHLNRRSVAGGVAVGLFAGLIPGSNPVQFSAAALGSLWLRVNLPVAVFTTLYSNPFTIVPLYLAAYTIGNTLLGTRGDALPAAIDIPWSDASLWVPTLLAWLGSLGSALVLGLFLLATGLALAGYTAVRLLWRFWIIRAWLRRRRRR